MDCSGLDDDVVGGEPAAGADDGRLRSGCIFLYLVPAIIFLLPTSLVSAELASGYEGGVYNWVARGISKPMGFLAVWCQFAMTIFYYPTLLGSWRAPWPM